MKIIIIIIFIMHIYKCERMLDSIRADYIIVTVNDISVAGDMPTTLQTVFLHKLTLLKNFVQC